jgi:TP901 family phage tail tape measure protein
MSDIKIEMDISDVVEKTSRMLQLTDAQRKVLANLIITTQNLNEANEGVAGQARTQIDYNNQLLISYRNVDGVIVAMNKTLRTTSEGMRKLKEETQAAASDANISKLNQLIGARRIQFSSEEARQVEKIREAIRGLNANIVTPERISEMLKAIRSGDTPVARLDSEIKLRRQLIDLVNIENKAKERLAEPGKVASQQKALADAEANRVRQIERETQRLSRQLTQNLGRNLDADRLTPQQQLRLQNLRRQIVEQIIQTDPKVDPNAIRGLFDQFLQGDFTTVRTGQIGAIQKSIGGLVTEYQKLAAAIRAEVQAEKEASAQQAAGIKERQQAAGRITALRQFFEKQIADLNSKFSVKPDDLNEGRLRTLRAAQANIEKIVAQNPNVTQSRIQTLLNTLQNNPTAPVRNETLQKVAQELSRILGIYKSIEDSQQRQQQLTINSLTNNAKTAASVQREEARTKVSEERVRRIVQSERQRLANIDPSFDLDQGSQGRLSTLGRRIAELGRQAQLSSRQLADMFQQVSSGNFQNIDGRFARLVDKIQQFQNIIKQSNENLSKNILNGAGGGPGGPGGVGLGGDDPFKSPKDSHIGKLNEYLGLLGKIKTSLQFFVIYRGFNILDQQVRAAVTSARDYQIQISLIRTISQDAQLSFNRWEQGIRGVSDALGTDFRDVANATRDAISNQIVKGDEAFDFIRKAGDLARVTGSTLQESTNLLSSVFNAYGLTAADTEEVAAKIFKTIDNGRIVMADLSNTFGRVAFIAKDLGVSLDEVLAILSTLTRAGVTTDDAITLLNNGMQKLTNPTEKLTAFLNELGFSSGRNAVKVLGFRNVLTQLVDAIKEGRVETTEFFNEQRSERFASAFRNQSGEVEKDLKDIGERAGDAYAQAIGIRAESAADRVNKAFNQLQNFATTNVGNEIIRLVDQMVQLFTQVDQVTGKFTNLDSTFKNVSKLVVGLATGFGSLVVVLRISAAISEAKALASLRLSAAKSQETATLVANTAAHRANVLAQGTAAQATASSSLGGFALANPAILVASLYSALMVGIASSSSVFNDNITEASQAFQDLVKGLEKAKIVNNLEEGVKKAKELNKEFNEASKTLGIAVAQALAKNTGELRTTREASRKLSEGLRNEFVAYLDLAKNKIQELRTEFNGIDNRIRESSKSLLRFKDGLDDIAFNTQQRYADDFQFLDVTRNQIGKLTEQATKLFRIGTPEAVAEARSLFDRISQLQQQIFDKNVDNVKKSFQQQGGSGTLLVDVQPLIQEQNRLLELRNTLEDKHVKQLENQKKIQADLLAQKEKDFAKQKEVVDKFLDFSLFDNGGALKKEFSTPEGKLDPDKARKAFEELSKQVEGFLDKDIIKRLDFSKLVDERRRLLVDEVVKATRDKDLRDTQNRLTEGVDTINKAFQEGEARIKSYTEKISGLQQTLSALAKNFVRVSEEGPDRIAGSQTTKFEKIVDTLFFGLPGLISKQAPNSTAGRAADFKEQLKKLKEEAAQIDKDIADLPNKTIDVQGRKVVDPAAVERIAGNLGTLRRKILAKIQEQLNVEGIDAKAEDLIVPGTTSRFGDALGVLDDLRKKLNEAKGELEQGQSAFARMQGEITTLNSLLKDSANAYTGLGNAGAAVFGTIGQAALAAQANVDQLLAQARAAIAKIEEMRRAANGAGGEPQKKSYGGPIYRAYGGPVGRDNQMIWARDDEFVMNPGATSRFYSQMVAMNNQGRVPKYFNNGGPISQDSITINVNESKTPGATAREVNRMLKRSKRRGAI